MDPAINSSENIFNFPKNASPETLLENVKLFLKSVKDPNYQPQFSYFDYRQKVKLLYDRSISCPNEIAKKIYSKCLSLLAIGETKYNSTQKTLTIKFIDCVNATTYNQHQLHSTTLLSDFINNHSESTSDLLTLDIKKDDFWKIIKMATEMRIESNIDLPKLYAQTSYLQIKALEQIIVKQIKELIVSTINVSQLKNIEDHFSKIPTIHSNEISAACFDKQVALHLKERDFASAIQCCTKILQLAPYKVDALVARAYSYVLQNNFQQALVDAMTALNSAPNNILALTITAHILLLHNKHEAIIYANAALRGAPTFVLALTIRAQIYLSLGNFGAALEDANKALLHEPNNLQALTIRAGIYRLQNKLLEALIDANRALELVPNDASIRQFKDEIEAELRRHQTGTGFTNPQ